MAVDDWSTSASLNTSVGGKNIAENMARADVNDAIRAVMADVKAKFDAVDDGYTLDEEQTSRTAQGTALSAYVVANNAGLAGTVNAAVDAFEARFRSNTSGTWYRKRIRDGSDLEIGGDTDHSLLQAMCDYNALWFGDADVPPGVFTVSQPIFLTHGLAYPWSTGKMTGAGRGFDGDGDFRGTSIVTTATDRPCLIDQGGRNTVIEDLSLRGPLYSTIIDGGFGTGSSEVDDTVGTAWDTGSIFDKQWAPLAAIAVDPYADTAPATPYPSIAPPAYLGPAQYYGRQVSSDTLITRTFIAGFNTAIVCHPSGGSSQTDYVHGRDVTVYGCKYGVSIGNSQSRLPTFDHLLMARLYCGFSNRLHGAQQGFFGGVATNCEIGACIKVFDFNISYIGRFTLDGAYSEACWHLGNIRGTSTVDGTLTMRGCEFNMSYPSGDYVAIRGVPKYIIGDPTSTTGYQGTGQINFEDTLLYFRTACPIMAKNVSLNRVTAYSLDAASAAGSTARAIAHNGSMGILMPPGARPDPAIVTGPRFNIDTLATGFSHTTDVNFKDTDRTKLIPWFVRKARPKNHNDDRYAVDVPLTYVGVAASGYTLSSQSGILVNLTQAASANTCNNTSQSPGCLVLHDLDGRWYYIKSRNYGTGAVVLEALGDYNDTGSGNTLRSAYAATGTLYFVETRYYTPAEAIIATCTSGSANVTLTTIAGGSVSSLTGEIAVGDYLWVDPLEEAPIFTTSTNKITAIDFAAGTATLSGNASASGDIRLGLMIRGT